MHPLIIFYSGVQPLQLSTPVSVPFYYLQMARLLSQKNFSPDSCGRQEVSGTQQLGG